MDKSYVLNTGWLVASGSGDPILSHTKKHSRIRICDYRKFSYIWV